MRRQHRTGRYQGREPDRPDRQNLKEGRSEEETKTRPRPRTKLPDLTEGERTESAGGNKTEPHPPNRIRGGNRRYGGARADGSRGQPSSPAVRQRDTTSTDSRAEDKTNETKPVTSSTNTTTAKPSASAGTSKPSASTSKPAAGMPLRQASRHRASLRQALRLRPNPQNRRSRLPLRRAGTSARPHPHSRAHSAHRHPRAIRRAAWAKVRTASGRTTGLPFIPIKRAVRRLSKRFNKLAVSNRRYGFMFRRGGQWPPFFAFCRGKIKGQTGGLPYGR